MLLIVYVLVESSLMTLQSLGVNLSMSQNVLIAKLFVVVVEVSENVRNR